MKKDSLLKNYLCIGLYTLTRIVFNFIYIRLIISKFGSEINGFCSTVMSIMGYLNIVEAGVGFATTYALYDPIRKKDYKKANSVLSFTNKYYRKIAIKLYIIIIFISVIYPLIISDFSNKYLGTYIILVYGCITLSEYFYDGKYKLLMNADQKMYLVNLIHTISYVLSTGTAIILLILNKNTIIVISCLLIGVITRFISITLVKRKYYAWINLDECPDDNVWKYSKDIFIQKISSLAFSSTDIILISTFIGIKEVSVYSVYNLVLNGLDNIMRIISEAPVNIFGRLFAEGNNNKFKDLYITYEHMCIIIATILTSCLFLLIRAFITIYTDGVSDINYHNTTLYMLMGTHFLVTYYRTTAATTLNISGKFETGKKIYSHEAILNIILSILLLFKYGINGVVLASVIAKMYSLFRIVQVVYKDILNKDIKEFIKKIIINLSIIVTILFTNLNRSIKCNGYIEFFVNGFIVFIMVSILVLFINLIIFKEIRKKIMININNKYSEEV